LPVSRAAWNEIEEKTGKTRGQLTLTHLFRSEPGNYARLIASLLPKDITIENTTGEMDDTQLDDVIARIQERLIDARASTARPVRGIEPKAIAGRVSEPAGGEIQAPVREQARELQGVQETTRVLRRREDA
jgi:hypothetical protein